MTNELSSNQSLDRADAVLSALAKGRPMRVSEISQAAELGQSTTSRMLSALESLGYVERSPGSGLYSLGLAFLTFAGSALNAHPVHRYARQPAQNLAASLGLGANVAIRRGDELFYLCNFEGRLAPKFFTLMGQRNPLHATALGKCLLAGLDGEQRRTLLPDLRRFTPNTLTTHEELDEAISLITEVGYSTEREELALGRTCLAAPIVDQNGSIAAAISISGPLSAIDLPTREPEISRIAIEVADSISSGLGYMGPADKENAAVNWASSSSA
jgi:DNA-binding IclR family transcriptional regulator